MEGFFKLIEQYSTQDEPAFCGPSSLAMVLNALSIDPRRTWKGSWRWFHERLLDCCKPIDAVMQEGIVLAEAACLAQCNGARVDLHMSGTFSEMEFRSAVVDVCGREDEHMVVSYSRKAFLQTGDGHFSPVGGYHAGRDLVLILDTARFKYPPHWVPLPMLFHAMTFIDPSTRLPRGFLRITASHVLDSLLFTLDIRCEGWRGAEGFIRTAGLQHLQALTTGSVPDVASHVSHLLHLAPLDSLNSFLITRSAAGALGGSARDAQTLLLDELRSTPLYEVVSRALPPEQEGSTPALLRDKACIMVWLVARMLQQEGQGWADPGQQQAFEQLVDVANFRILKAELDFVSEQYRSIDSVLAGSVTKCSSCTEQLDCAALGH